MTHSISANIGQTDLYDGGGSSRVLVLCWRRVLRLLTTAVFVMSDRVTLTYNVETLSRSLQRRDFEQVISACTFCIHVAVVIV